MFTIIYVLTYNNYHAYNNFKCFVMKYTEITKYTVLIQKIYQFLVVIK